MTPWVCIAIMAKSRQTKKNGATDKQIVVWGRQVVLLETVGQTNQKLYVGQTVKTNIEAKRRLLERPQVNCWAKYQN